MVDTLVAIEVVLEVVFRVLDRANLIFFVDEVPERDRSVSQIYSEGGRSCIGIPEILQIRWEGDVLGQT